MRPEELNEIQEMLYDCQNRDQYLTEWETDFIESLDEQLTDRNWISERQYGILERIWNRVTARG